MPARRRASRGSASVEYGLIVALIGATLCLGIGVTVKSVFQQTINCFLAELQGQPAPPGCGSDGSGGTGGGTGGGGTDPGGVTPGATTPPTTTPPTTTPAETTPPDTTSASPSPTTTPPEPAP